MNQSTTPSHDSRVEKIRFGSYRLNDFKQLQILAPCFPALREVDLGICKSNPSYPMVSHQEEYQYQLDLSDFINLERLKMNIARPFQDTFSFYDICFKRVIIQVLYKATRSRYFCREGDFGSHNINNFIEIYLETKDSYMAKPSSFDSDHEYTCSISIQAGSTFSKIILDHSDDY